MRERGGVCIYVRTTNQFQVCVKYENSICHLPIINLHHSSLIIILMFHPPSCSAIQFNDIILKVKSYRMPLPFPFPNIIMIGDIIMICSSTSMVMNLPVNLIFLDLMFSLMNLLTVLPLQTHFYMTTVLLMLVAVNQTLGYYSN